MKRIVGLDPSLTGFGLVVLTRQHFTEKFANDYLIERREVIKTKAKDNLFDRCTQIIAILMPYIEDPDTVIVLEDYAVGKHSGAIISTITLGALLRYFLRAYQKDYWQVPPTVLKKFVTGSGNAPKELVMAHAVKKWGFMAKDNNEADAYALAALGAYMGLPLMQTKVDAELIKKCEFIKNTA